MAGKGRPRDRGNILCLKLRCEQRGIGFEVEALELGDKLKPKEYDLIFAGGAQDLPTEPSRTKRLVHSIEIVARREESEHFVDAADR